MDGLLLLDGRIAYMRGEYCKLANPIVSFKCVSTFLKFRFFGRATHLVKRLFFYGLLIPTSAIMPSLIGPQARITYCTSVFVHKI